MCGENVISFKNAEFQLYGYLVQLQEMFKTNCIGESEIEKINENIQLIQSRKFNVAVMGEFKRGKSSLINAMLGLKVLPADVTPATATINRITYGNEPSLTIFYKDGTKEAADMKNISNYVTMLTEEGLKRAAQINEAVIGYPTVICQNHVDIIDTPGLNDNIEMTRVTMNMLKNIDAAIVVVSALAPFSEKESEFVCELLKSDNIENIVFVVTHIDQIDEDEQDKLIAFIQNRINKNISEFIKQDNCMSEILIKAKRVLDNPMIFGVSSYLALKSFITGDRQLLKMSNFEEFKTELYEFLTSQQGMNTMRKAVKGIRNASSEFDRLSNFCINKVEQDISLIDEKTVVLNNYLKEYKKKFAAVFQEVNNSLRISVDEVLKLKDSFLNNFSKSIGKARNEGRDQTIVILSSDASMCLEIANEEILAKIRDQLTNTLITAIENYSITRKSEFVEAINELKKICGFNFEFSKAFDNSIKEQTASFETPRFNWIVSPVPIARYFLNYNLLDNAKYAVNTSVQQFYTDWDEYVISIKKWWLQQINNEAISAAALYETVKETRERKQNELLLLRNTYSQQKAVLENIKTKTTEIYNEILL